NDHPDHDTIATFRRRFLKEIEGLFVRVLLLAREMGVLKMGTVGLDGTKIEARAKERYERERAEHEAELAARAAKTATTGKKPGGKPPAPPVEGPLPK